LGDGGARGVNRKYLEREKGVSVKTLGEWIEGGVRGVGVGMSK